MSISGIKGISIQVHGVTYSTRWQISGEITLQERLNGDHGPSDGRVTLISALQLALATLAR